jgi:hypothetical protein
MSTPIRAGVFLGVLVAVWQFVMGFTGWYKDPVLLNVFFLVIVFEVAVLIWALRKTAPEATYGRQVVNGVVISLVAGAIIVCTSLVFTTIAFPDYFREIQAAQAGMLKARGLSEADIQAQVAASAAMQTPLMNALSGFIGTVVTGLVVSATAAFFLRNK